MKILALLFLCLLTRPALAEFKQVVEPNDSYSSFVDYWGTFGTPNLKAKASRYVDGKLINQVHFNYDEFGRRIVPQPAVEKTKTILFFGNSEIFGDLLETEDTLPAHFAQLAPSVRVYNYAFVGHGPHHMYMQSLHRDFAKEISGKVDWVIYPLFDYDLNRMYGDSRSIEYGAVAPSLAPDASGNVAYEGPFEQAHPFKTRLYRWLDQFFFTRIWNKSYPTNPIYLPTLDKKDSVFLCQVFEETKRNFERRLPGAQLIVLIHPKNAGVRATLKRCLVNSSLKLIDTAMFYQSFDPTKLSGADGSHLSSYGHQVLAAEIIRQLQP